MKILPKYSFASIGWIYRKMIKISLLSVKINHFLFSCSKIYHNLSFVRAVKDTKSKKLKVNKIFLLARGFNEFWNMREPEMISILKQQRGLIMFSWYKYWVFKNLVELLLVVLFILLSRNLNYEKIGTKHEMGSCSQLKKKSKQKSRFLLKDWKWSKMNFFNKHF